MWSHAETSGQGEGWRGAKGNEEMPQSFSMIYCLVSTLSTAPCSCLDGSLLILHSGVKCLSDKREGEAGREEREPRPWGRSQLHHGRGPRALEGGGKRHVATAASLWGQKGHHLPELW